MPAGSMKDIGTYEITIQFMGSYEGSIKKIYDIVPQGTSLLAITPSKKGFSLKWKKQASQTIGYEIAYFTDNKFSKKAAKVISVKKNKTVSKSVTK